MKPVVLFDLDGLLVDSEPKWDAAKQEVFEPLGLHLTPNMQLATRGFRQQDMVAYWFERVRWKGPHPDEVEARIVAAVCRRIGEGVRAMPGAFEAVATCSRVSRAMAVVSSSPAAVIRAALASVDLDGSFDAIFSAEDDDLGKPHPDAYLRAASTLGAPARACVVIEDSVAGVLAGAAAQMSVIAVPAATDRSDPRFAIADVMLPSLEHLDEALFEALFEVDSTSWRGAG